MIREAFKKHFLHYLRTFITCNDELSGEVPSTLATTIGLSVPSQPLTSFTTLDTMYVFPSYQNCFIFFMILRVITRSRGSIDNKTVS